jgi:hypothetical protein
LDEKGSQISPESSRWDFDSVVSKWKRVVMHDKSMGRSGVGHSSTAHPLDSDIPQHDVRPPRPGEDTSTHPNRLRPLQNTAAMSPDPVNASTPASSTNYASPYSHADPRSPPSASAPGPQAKRPRLMNGSEGLSTAEPATIRAPGPGSWPSSTPILSNLAAPSGQTPPSASRG